VANAEKENGDNVENEGLVDLNFVDDSVDVNFNFGVPLKELTKVEGVDILDDVVKTKGWLKLLN
jgi:hypothetical protein